MLCSKHHCIVLSAKHNKKLYVEKGNFLKNRGLFLNMAKRCFGLGGLLHVTCLVVMVGCMGHFEGFNGSVVCFLSV